MQVKEYTEWIGLYTEFIRWNRQGEESQLILEEAS